MNSTRMKIKDNDTTLTFADYEPYGENQLHSTDDIPKRGYMGSHKSKENGYMQMGARLYNAETGRFMSVDPLMEIFTGHSPYHYSYNNPVMFSDPSGLAPEGEKNNKTQGLNDDAISSGLTSGYWVTQTHTSYFMLDCSPNMGGRERSASGSSGPILREFSSTFESSYWMPGISGSASGNGGGLGMITPSGRSTKSGGRTSSKVHTTSLNKSMRDQIYNEGSYGNKSGDAVADETRVCVGCENNNYSSDVSLKNYFDYDGDGELSPLEFTLAFIDAGGTVFDIVTFPSGEGLVIHGALVGIGKQFGKVTTKNIVKTSLKFSEHAIQRMALRKVTPKMVEKVISKGQKFYDPLNKSFNYILPNAFASGQSILVGTNPTTGLITTVYKSSKNLIKPRMIKIN